MGVAGRSWVNVCMSGEQRTRRCVRFDMQATPSSQT